jgi:hypothetical protein
MKYVEKFRKLMKSVQSCKKSDVKILKEKIHGFSWECMAPADGTLNGPWIRHNQNVKMLSCALSKNERS